MRSLDPAGRFTFVIRAGGCELLSKFPPGVDVLG